MRQLRRLRRAGLRQPRVEAARAELAGVALQPVDRARRSPAPAPNASSAISASRSTSPPPAIRIARLRCRVPSRRRLHLLGALAGGEASPAAARKACRPRSVVQRGRRRVAVRRATMSPSDRRTARARDQRLARCALVRLDLEREQLGSGRRNLGACPLVRLELRAVAGQGVAADARLEVERDPLQHARLRDRVVGRRALTAVLLWPCRPSRSTPNVISETTAIAPAAASTRKRRPQARRTRPL